MTTPHQAKSLQKSDYLPANGYRYAMDVKIKNTANYAKNTTILVALAQKTIDRQIETKGSSSAGPKADYTKISR